ncbi:DUF6879 family protein [Streptosporangium sp. NPDC049644]|uniref:DUF6879 family protein n=1 Tax=Streptosporangium sp. NPDC049644 TaxID=3155507 RepID=UPI003431B990
MQGVTEGSSAEPAPLHPGRLPRAPFAEQGSPSRDAFRRGDRKEALRLLDERREDLLAVTREDERRGSFFHRVRVVETPLTPHVGKNTSKASTRPVKM